MNKFIFKILIFISLLILSQIILVIIYFKIDVQPFILNKNRNVSQNDIYIFGNSHSQCAINDALLPDKFVNLSQSSEPLFYTCSKARNILEKFKNDTVIIEFTNISPLTTDWVLGDKHFVRNSKKHAKELDFFQHKFLIQKSLIKYIKAMSSLSLIDLFEINKVEGSFLRLERFEISDKVVNFKNRWIPNDTNINSFSDEEKNINFSELQRLIREFSSTDFILIRSPMHKSFEYFNEEDFQRQVNELMKERNVVFYDFSGQITNDSFFGDVEHLNYLGAEFFSPVLLKTIRKLPAL